MPEAPVIARRSLTDELVERLRDLIVEGEFQPGERLGEKALCERFGVSRTPLREALKILATEGLLELSPNRGARIAGLSAADLDELFPLLGALEALAGELAAARIDEAGIAEVRALHYQMVAHYHRGDLAGYFRLNQQIHEQFLAAAGNATLSAMHRSLSGRLRPARYAANMSPARWRQAVAEHEEMLSLLAARDGVALGALLRRHLDNKAETLREALDGPPGDAEGRCGVGGGA